MGKFKPGDIVLRTFKDRKFINQITDLNDDIYKFTELFSFGEGWVYSNVQLSRKTDIVDINSELIDPEELNNIKVSIL